MPVILIKPTAYFNIPTESVNKTPYPLSTKKSLGTGGPLYAQISVNGLLQGSIALDSKGMFTFDINLNQGTNQIFIQITDSAGTTIKRFGGFKIVLDTIPPALPVLSKPPLKVYYNELSIGGTAEVGSRISIFRNTVGQGTCPVDSNGKFSYAMKLLEGLNEITASATDTAKNISPLSLPVVTTYQIHPLVDLPVENIDGISTTYAQKLGLNGIRTLRDFAIADVPGLSVKTSLSPFRLMTWQRKSILALSIKIEKSLFSKLLGMRLSEIILVDDNTLCQRGVLPLESVQYLKERISILFICLDDSITLPMKLDQIVV